MKVYIVRVHLRGGFIENLRCFTKYEEAAYFIDSGAAEIEANENPWSINWMKFSIEEMELFERFDESAYPPDMLWQDEEDAE